MFRCTQWCSPTYPKIHCIEVKWVCPCYTIRAVLHDSRVRVGTGDEGQTIPSDKAFHSTFVRCGLCLNPGSASFSGCIQRLNTSQQCNKAVPVRRLLQMWSRNASFFCRVAKDPTGGSFAAQHVPQLRGPSKDIAYDAT